MARPHAADVVTPADDATALDRLAAAHGVATSYEDFAGRAHPVAPETVAEVLAAMGVDAATPAAVQQALASAAATPWQELLPPTVVAVAGRGGRVRAHAPAGTPVRLEVRLEDGGARTDLRLLPVREMSEVDGVEVQRHSYELPADLPPGWHALVAVAGDREATAALVVAPDRLRLPAGMRRAWGWMLQLYSVRSAASWGMGDYGDLRDIVAWSGSADGGGAGLVLCNPLHAPTPVPPVQNSPYYPSSRRFRSPLYLRVADLPEYAAAPPDVRSTVDGLRPDAPADRVDRDLVWAAKRAALEVLYPYAAAPDRDAAMAAFRTAQGSALADFALFCALAERHGADWHDWPEPLHDPRSDAVAAARAELADRVGFHAWLQLCCDEQLAAAAAAARDAGMPVGVVHDLAVGVDPGGADAWALQAVLAGTATVGAPPDLLNQLGQDWRLPPWHPRRLAEEGYAPFRDMVRSVLRHAGGIRVDHVMGLFRLWWVPPGRTADRGSYVSYDAAAMLAVLALEAHRAGAVVVGEDLGTVQPAVRAALAAAGVLGSDIAWFQQDEEGRPVPPGQWRELAMASVTTHDLPTVAGWLTGEAVLVRDRLGQLGVPLAQEQERVDRERQALLGLLRAEGLLEGAPTVESVSLALHRLLVASPCRLVLAAFGDAVGDPRQPNLPGTLDEYPNWRLPVADPQGTPLPLERLRAHPGVGRLVDVLREVR